MKPQEQVCDIHSWIENKSPQCCYIIVFEGVQVFEIRLIGIHLFLRLNMPEFTGKLPPLRRALNHHHIWLYVLDKLLSSNS